jgi:hypothetical protein
MYPLAYDSWDNEEKQALRKVIDSGRYTMGNEVAEYVDINGFFIGNDSRDLTDPLSLVKSVIKEVYDKQKN